MASVVNAFSALQGAGENVSGQLSKAAKKRAKAKAAAAATPAANGAAANGAAAAAPASAPAAAPQTAANGNAAKPQASQVVSAAEGVAILERAAREAKTVGEKCQLWKDWARQASDKSGKGYRFRDDSGNSLDFKTVLLKSKALEITVESALVSGLNFDRLDNLAQVLSTFLGGDQGPLASAICRLAQLVADETPDTVGAAQRAVRGVVAGLKTGGRDQQSTEASPLAAWVNRVASLDKEIASQQSILNKLAATSGGTITKEQANVAKNIYRLQGEKFDLLQPEGLPTFKATAQAGEHIRGLEELKAVINSHLKQASAMEVSTKGKAASAEAQRVQTLAAYRREENILAQEAQEVATQIRSMEAQLKALKSKQVELEEKRSQLQQRQRMMLDSMGSKSGPGVLSAAHYRDELAVVEGLQDLVDPSHKKGASPEQVLAIQSQQANAGLEFVADGQRYMTMVLAALTDMPQKISFAKQRVTQAEKLLKLGGGIGEKLLTQHTQQKKDAENLLAETVRGAEDLLRNSLQVAADVSQRYDALVRFSPDHAGVVADQLRAIDALAMQIRAQHDAVQAAHLGLAPAPVAPVPSYTAPVAAAPIAPIAPPAMGQLPGFTPAAAPVPRSAPAGAYRTAPQPAVSAPAAGARPVSAAPEPIARPTPAAAPAPAAPRAPPRQWGKPAAPAAPVPGSEDPSLSEAFPTLQSSTAESADGFTAAKKKKNAQAA